MRRCLQGEVRSIGLRVGDEGLLEHDLSEGRVEVEFLVQRIDNDFLCEVLAIVWEEAVVR
jgi:hypothetical protein